MGSLILSPVTACNVISTIQQDSDVCANDVILVSSLFSYSPKGDAALTIAVGHITQLTRSTKIKSTKMLGIFVP